MVTLHRRPSTKLVPVPLHAHWQQRGGGALTKRLKWLRKPKEVKEVQEEVNLSFLGLALEV